MANLSNQLTKLFLGGNQLSGTIPEGFGNFVNLYLLGLELNSLSGVIPRDFGKLQNLQHLHFDNNQFSGQIASTVCNAITLYYLDLSFNHGSLPPEIGKLVHLVDFNVSHNKFVGAIPSSLADCSNLANLSMQANFFQGTIPPNLASLKSIQQIDLSSNNLTGSMPKELEKLQYLRNLNLSYNDIEGEIPNTGIFSNANQISLIGNNKFCGGILELEIFSRKLNWFRKFWSCLQRKARKHSNKFVAVKVLDLQKNGASKSFKAECKALRNIRHRNLVSIVSYCSSIDSKGDEFKALVYELMENGNLDLWLHPETTDKPTSSRSLNLSQKLNIAIDVASTLQYLHNHCVLRKLYQIKV
ncbi:unnamed protein product [Coffea canephora]|uniref:Protein kinase domain-containing protein n=1 Tax=Coffea canephora TaxID=49390 RepID=A0A068V7S9_COFCA|nr:unnamed protein product [Coffea canephora]